MRLFTSDNPQSEIRNPKSPFTDSPWFYVLVFSLMALLALIVIGPKYGQRQSAMDRKYQARERIEDGRAARNNSGVEARNNDVADRRSFATPDDTLVPLWPLAVVLSAVALFATYMLLRGRGRLATASSEQSGSLPDSISSP
jgi:hypothetical protein